MHCSTMKYLKLNLAFILPLILLSDVSQVRADITVELLLNSLESTEDIAFKNNSGYKLEIVIDGPKSKINWVFRLDRSAFSSTGRQIVFGERLTSTRSNPIQLRTEYKNNTSYPVEFVLKSFKDSSQWRFFHILQPTPPVPLAEFDAPWHQVTLTNGTLTLNLFFRWYCPRWSYGEICENQCDLFSCPSGFERNATGQNVTTPFDKSCPFHPCIIQNLSNVEQLNPHCIEEMVLSRLTNLNSNASVANVKGKVILNAVQRSDETNVVAIGAYVLDANGVPFPAQVIHKVLQYLSQTEALSTCIGQLQPLQDHSALDNVLRKASVERDNSIKPYFIGGFWVVIIMAVVLSCLVVILVRNGDTRTKRERGQSRVGHSVRDEVQPLTENLDVKNP